MQYAILGKLTAKPKIDGKRVKVRKKAHMLHRGRTLCRAENGYKKRPRYTEVENPETWQICRICLGMDGVDIPERPRHPVRSETSRRRDVLPDEPRSAVSEVGHAVRADALERLETDEDEYAEPLLSVLLGERAA